MTTPKLTARERHVIADYMNRVPFVRWDRCTVTRDAIRVFGWIDRPRDRRSDFLVLEIVRADMENVAYTTSSAAYSEKIGDLLFGEAVVQGEHTPCQRVEHEFRGLVRNVVIGGNAAIGGD